MTSRAAVLLALTSSTMAIGSATVVNQCGFPVYMASVGSSFVGDMQEIHGSYTEQYSQEGVGISIKLSPNDSIVGPVSQFEFTWANGKISYDISNINGNPFANNGMEIKPSTQGDGGNPTCQAVDCPAGQATCSAAYNQPNDVRTMVCDQDTDLVLTVCPGGPSKRSLPAPAVVGHSHQRVHARHLPRLA